MLRIDRFLFVAEMGSFRNPRVCFSLGVASHCSLAFARKDRTFMVHICDVSCVT